MNNKNAKEMRSAKNFFFIFFVGKKKMSDDESKSKKRKADMDVPTLAIELSPNFGILDKITIKIKLIVKDIECVANIIYIPNELVLDTSKLPEYLFKTSLHAKDLTSYCHKLHESLQYALNTKTLNIKFDGNTAGDIVVSTSKMFKAKKPRKGKAKKDDDEDDS